MKKKWQLKKAIVLLKRIIFLEKHVEKLLITVKKKTPSAARYFYAGIDGGATSTKTVVADETGKIIGKATSGPSHPNLVGVIRTFDSLITGLKRATENAGLNFKTTHFKRICAGMCGINTLAEHLRITELMKKYTKRFAQNIKDSIIIQDSLLAWYGALGGRPGVMVIGGTGFIVYGYNKGREGMSKMKGIRMNSREVAHLGGRDIAYHAALRIRKRLNKRTETKMVSIWRAAFKRGDLFAMHSNLPFTNVIDMFIGSAYRKGGGIADKDIAATAKLIFESVNKGDGDAKAVIAEASTNAAIYVSKVAEKIGLHNMPFYVAFVGSVIRHPFALHQLGKSLPLYEPYAKIIKPQLEPPQAGVQIAMKNIRFY
jgi:N-acetylglucosamine kinase-like BadF-type ATPase